MELRTDLDRGDDGIAAMLGVDRTKYRVIGGQDVRLDTHPHLVLSQFKLVDKKTGEEVIIPFRVRHARLGKVFTKLTDEHPDCVIDHASVDRHHGEAMALNRFKNDSIHTAIADAVPDLDPTATPGAPVYNLQAANGDEMLADLVDGKLTNLRRRPPLPSYDTDEAGNLVVDLRDLKIEHQAAAHAAIKHHANVVVRKSAT